ncbi:MAG: hypothetical protein A2289_10860 [Deltaproteobacteria bacterium RIFOXYA12_FULL_58_15]|nr:MAG: hypothetical protein A2289_10860 [Deltaproteobacteria bacterium RIFOXYA12_FULL_58_15]OGR09933.1 MAG: hypothetical protein A2341_27440 [Deltaproteobacteria bacterium RIFOXYB12_FULL_58_9]
MSGNFNGATWSSTFVEPQQVVYRRQPASLEQVKAGLATLGLGATGPGVAALQAKLNILLEHYKPFDDLSKLVVDSDLGQLTYRGVWWVQETFGLKLDGLVGPETLGKIDELISGIEAGRSINKDVAVRTNVTTDRSIDRATDPLASRGTTRNPAPKGPLGLTGRVGLSCANRSNDVVAVQRALVKHEYLKADEFDKGVFDEATQKALRAFQSEQTPWRDLRVDIGGDTAKMLAGPKVDRLPVLEPISVRPIPPPVAAPEISVPIQLTGISAMENFAARNGRVTGRFAGDKKLREQQAQVILKSQGLWPPVEGRVYAIQIDQDTPPSGLSWKERKAFLRSYTGQMVVFQGKGQSLVEMNHKGPFRSASHPSEATARDSGTPDVNSDGKGDVAHLAPGAYEYSTTMRRLRKSDRFVSVRDVIANRDLNQDGVISGADEQELFPSAGLQIHGGPERHPDSAGCQSVSNEGYGEFTQLVRSGAETFTYVLVRCPYDGWTH